MNTENITESTGPFYPKGKILMRDDEGKALAVGCLSCGRFALDTVSKKCVICALHDTVIDPIGYGFGI